VGPADKSIDTTSITLPKAKPSSTALGGVGGPSKEMSQDDEKSSLLQDSEGRVISLDLGKLRSMEKLPLHEDKTTYFFEDDPRTPVGDLQETFKTFDVNNDGRITVGEMTAVMKTLGAEMKTEEVQWLIEQFDYNSNGTIEWAEFVRMMKEIGAGIIGEMKEIKFKDTK